MMFDNISTTIIPEPWLRGVVRVLLNKNWQCWKLPLQPKSGRPAPAADRMEEWLWCGQRGQRGQPKATRKHLVMKHLVKKSPSDTSGEWGASLFDFIFIFPNGGTCFRSVSCSFQSSCSIFVRSCPICKRITWHLAGILISHWFVLLLTNLSF